MNGKVLVIGSNGFVGFSLVKRLMRLNFNVIAGISSPNSAYRVCTIPVEKVVIDITSYFNQNIFKEVDYVINCSTGSSKVIEEGTKNILNACLKYKVKKYLHLSSVDVYGNLKGEISENSLKNPKTPYGKSKLASEKICKEFIKKGLNITILRPAIIYGEDSELWVTRICKRVTDSNFKISTKTKNSQCNLIHISDLTEICIEALKNNKTSNKIYNITSEEKISWFRYYNFFKKELLRNEIQCTNHFKLRFKLLILDKIKFIALFFLKNFQNLVLNVANSTSTVKNIFKKSQNVLTTNLNLNELDLVCREAFYSNDQFNKDFIYKLRFNSEKGITSSIKWYKSYFDFKK